MWFSIEIDEGVEESAHIRWMWTEYYAKCSKVSHAQAHLLAEKKIVEISSHLNIFCINLRLKMLGFISAIDRRRRRRRRHCTHCFVFIWPYMVCHLVSSIACQKHKRNAIQLLPAHVVWNFEFSFSFIHSFSGFLSVLRCLAWYDFNDHAFWNIWCVYVCVRCCCAWKRKK